MNPLIVIYIVFVLLSAAFTWFVTLRNVRDETQYGGCVTLGTACLALFMTIVTFIPVANAVMGLLGVIGGAFEYEYEIAEFFSKPLCKRGE